MAEKEAPEELEVEQAETANEVAEEATEAELVSKLQDDLEAAQTALADAEEQVLRAKADAQNMRRRAEQDVAKAHKFALEKFVNELLPVIDSLERAVEACPQDNAETDPIRQGVEMTLNLFMNSVKKFSVEPIDPQGEPFDPQLHQAMSMVENPDVEPNTVIAVMQKGYLLNERLVRPAMVMVSKAASGEAGKIDEKA